MDYNLGIGSYNQYPDAIIDSRGRIWISFVSNKHYEIEKGRYMSEYSQLYLLGRRKNEIY